MHELRFQACKMPNNKWFCQATHPGTEDLLKTREYDNQLRRAQAKESRKAKMTEKRKKRAEKRRRINAESKKYNTCFYVDKEEWESLDRPGITIVDGDGSPMAKYELVPIEEEEEEICYFHRIDA